VLADPTATLGSLSQVAPLASVSAAAPAAASASTAAAAAQPPVYQQVIAPVLHLSARGDGIHRVLLELHPADLGAVNVEVRIQSGSMSIAINSGSDAARESIRASLPQLHQELANAGLGGTGVSLDFGSSDSAASGGRESAQQRGADSASTLGRTRESAIPSATAPASLAASGIDRWL
jgi:flagellar hook-length control protein FliK